MTTLTQTTQIEEQIRTFVEDRVRAVQAKDLEGLLTHHAPDVVMFDVVDPLRYQGAERARQRTADWFEGYRDPLGYQIRDLSITAGEDVAFCHYLYHVTGTLKEGGQVAMWVRATLCFQRRDDRWVLTHEHDSVPFDPQSGRASVDLEP